MGFAFADDAFDKFMRCTNFEVDFDSRITSTLGWTAQDGRAGEHDGAWRVRALDVPIDFTALSPERSLSWAETSYFQDYTYPCGDDEPPLHSYAQYKAGSAVAGKLRMLLSMDLNPREPPLEGQPAPDPPDDYLQILFQSSPKETYESWNEGCDNPNTRTPDTQSRWWTAFQGFHVGQSSPFKVRINRGDQVGDLIYSRALAAATSRSTWARSAAARRRRTPSWRSGTSRCRDPPGLPRAIPAACGRTPAFRRSST